MSAKETSMEAPGTDETDEQAAETGTVGSLIGPPLAVFYTDMIVSDAIEKIRAIPQEQIFTYGYVLDANEQLSGVLIMRRLLTADPDSRLADIMEGDVFFLTPEMTFLDAMKSTMTRHYPEYPICDENQHLIGVVRGEALFTAEVVSLTAQAGEMVGVTDEDGPETPFWRSMRLRLPWLQANMLTAFLAAGVVGFFQDLIDRIVLLAVFLPVLAGQTGNSGAQSLAVTLRAVSLGWLTDEGARAQVIKEALLGILNGAIGGLFAGGAMWAIATTQNNSSAMTLGIVVFIAMTFSSLVSGFIGGLLPIALRKLGADPAVASTILLSTVTDTFSMGSMLLLALWLV
jgi:magnesium transporter